MMNLSQQFSDRLEAYLTASGMRPAEFGRLALEDSTFVARIRKGRSFTMKKADRALAYMNANPVEGIET